MEVQESAVERKALGDLPIERLDVDVLSNTPLVKPEVPVSQGIVRVRECVAHMLIKESLDGAVKFGVADVCREFFDGVELSLGAGRPVPGEQAEPALLGVASKVVKG